MRQLLPEAIENVDLRQAFAVPQGPRQHVRVNMVSSLDGRATAHGHAGGLSTEADRRVFDVLRSHADIVVIGAGTARAENYGPARFSGELLAARQSAQQSDEIPIAVITQSGELDWDARLFVDAEAPALVITGADGAHNAAGHISPDNLLVAGNSRVDISVALRLLEERGFRNVLSEGGPSLNAEFIASTALDELCLTLSPLVTQGLGPTIITGPELSPPHAATITHLYEDEGSLFLRCALRP